MVNNEKMKPRDWLGLALLDNEWNIQTEIVVDVQSVVRGAQDFRLFVLGGDNRQTINEPSTVYLSSNDVLLPLRLIPPADKESTTTWTQLDVVFEPQPRQQQSSTTPTLQVWAAPKKTQCAPCAKARSCGKNFNFFATGDDALPRHHLWAEVWPSAPHLVRLVGDDSPCRRDQEPQQTHLTEDSPVASFAIPGCLGG